MKLLNKPSTTVINAATKQDTTFYRVTLDMLKDAIEDDNIILQELVNEKGFQAFDFENNLYGSEVVDGILYICDTDGRDIEVNGNLIDPEDALYEYDIDDLSEYIEKGTKSIIKSNLSYYELDDFDIDEVATALLNSGYSFDEIVKSAKKMNII